MKTFEHVGFDPGRDRGRRGRDPPVVPEGLGGVGGRGRPGHPDGEPSRLLAAAREQAHRLRRDADQGGHERRGPARPDHPEPAERPGQPPAGPDPPAAESEHEAAGPAEPPGLPRDGGRLREHRLGALRRAPCSTSPRPRNISRPPSASARSSPATPPGSTRCWARPSCPTSPRSSRRSPSRSPSPGSRSSSPTTGPPSPRSRPTVVTDANNFFILDFLLFLEYIESAFYAVNVPRFT